MTPRPATRAPVTRSELAAGFASLGPQQGGTVLVHCSLASLGHVVGGAVTVCDALRQAVGPSGTVVMPGFTPQLVHPAAWRVERRHGADAERLGDEIPPFDPVSTPVARTVGAVPDCFRTRPGTARSAHPHVSFLAEGPLAEEVTGRHPLEWRLSAAGPLGRLWDLDAEILMLGTDWSTCTSLHLAEYAAPYPGRRFGNWRVPLGRSDDGRTAWAPVRELIVWEGDFELLGREADSKGSGVGISRGPVAGAECRLVRLRDLVRFAIAWLPQRRDLSAFADPPGWLDLETATDALPGVPSLGCREAPAGTPDQQDKQESAA